MNPDDKSSPEWFTPLLAEAEGERLERTVSLTNFDKYGEAVCAFANDIGGSGKPGHLLIGVKDNGSIAGLRITDEFIAALGGLRADGNIVPVPVMSIEKISLQGGDVLVLKVFPSLMPPVRFKGRTWIRVGARKAIATREEEDRLLERRDSSGRTSNCCGNSSFFGAPSIFFFGSLPSVSRGRWRHDRSTCSKRISNRMRPLLVSGEA